MIKVQYELKVCVFFLLFLSGAGFLFFVSLRTIRACVYTCIVLLKAGVCGICLRSWRM